MISIRKLFEEISPEPKAIFMAGPAGSGKTYIIDRLLDKTQFYILNIDNHYERLLKKSGMGMDQKAFDHNQLSQAATLMGQAKKMLNADKEDKFSKKENVIIDGTGGSSSVIMKSKSQLEDLGYKTFMIMLYVSPLVSLERNHSRERSLKPSIVTRSWKNSISNIGIFRKMFGNDFILINNDPKNMSTKGSIGDYFDSPLDDSKHEINDQIKVLESRNYKFDSIPEAKNKIDRWMKK